MNWWTVHALSSSLAQRRRKALEDLGRTRSPRFLGSILPLLEDDVVEVRLAAIEALAMIGDPAAVDGLTARLDDPDGSVRQAAVRALGKLGARPPDGRPKSSEDKTREDYQHHLEKIASRDPFPLCGGCGQFVGSLEIVYDKKNNRGYLCQACRTTYASHLEPDSPYNFWMCGGCGFRVLAHTQIDAEVDHRGNACPNCGMDINFTLVNLFNDSPTGSGVIGEPEE